MVLLIPLNLTIAATQVLLEDLWNLLRHHFIQMESHLCPTDAHKCDGNFLPEKGKETDTAFVQ